jgi:pPIWI_RE three-gene island domain Y/REase associating with pPIWI_RE
VITPYANAPTELIYAVARCFFELAAQRQTDSFRLPYPPNVQLTLDRVVLDCLRRGVSAPSTIPDLVRRFTAGSTEEPPIMMPIGFVPPRASLISDLTRLPTRTCAELASVGENGVEHEAERMLAEIAEACPSVEVFETCRDLLISNVVINPERDRLLNATPRLSMNWQRLRRLYEEVPAAYTTREMGERVFVRCRECDLPGLPLPDERWLCESGYCEIIETPDRHPMNGIRLLPTPLRLFLSLPGGPEQAIRRRLASAGITTTLIPDRLGAYRYTRSTGETGILRVYDREQPTLLAARLAEEPASPGEREIAVIPDRVIARHSTYLATIAEYMPEGKGPIISSETDLNIVIGFSDREQKEGAHA